MALKFKRQLDSQWQPFQLHLARCSRWGPGAERALRTGKTREATASSTPNYGGYGGGDDAGADQTV